MLTLTCLAAISNPHSTLVWYNNGVPLSVSSSVITTDGDYDGKTTKQVYSSIVTKTDNKANITCKASSLAGIAAKTVLLDILCKYQAIPLVFTAGIFTNINECILNIKIER